MAFLQTMIVSSGDKLMERARDSFVDETIFGGGPWRDPVDRRVR